MSRARALWKANQDLVEACLGHPFVQGIARGELARESFTFYVSQDAYFLESFTRAYALAIARAPDRDAMVAFRDLLDGVLEELELHRSYAERWGVDLDPLPAPATQAYTDFLLRVAWSEPVGRIVAAMTPCMALYHYLGTSLQPRLNPESPYREWVETYGAEEFGVLVEKLDRLLERYDDGSPLVDRYYRAAMDLEFRFFEQAWRERG